MEQLRFIVISVTLPRGPDLGAQVVLKRKWEKRHWQKYYDRGGKTL